MPRKFADGELVGVHFSSRHTYAHFLGIVEDYKDRKYHVRFLGGDKRLSNDVVFECTTRELYVPNNSHIDERRNVQLEMYNNLLQQFATGGTYRAYMATDTIMWASFALTRIKDMAWSRKFPITTTHGRQDYVY